MAGYNVDRTKAALDTVRESPGITAIAVAPVLVGFGAIWLIAGFGWAVLALLGVAVIAGVKFYR